MASDPGLAFTLLALRLGRVVPGLLDSYWGAPDVAARVAAEAPLGPRRLADDAAALLADLPARDLDPARRRALAGRTAALRSLALHHSGEPRPWADAVEAAFSVRPVLGDPSRYARAHDRLDTILPGPAPLADRYRAYRETMLCPPHRAREVLEALTVALRDRTRDVLGAATGTGGPLVPGGDAVEWELAEDPPWAALARHLGGRRTRVVLAAGAPLRLTQLPGLIAHETFPGHHLQGLHADVTRVARGWSEHAVTLVATPDCLIAEGAAQLGLLLVAGERWGRFAAGVYASLGLSFDPGLAEAVTAAVAPLEEVRQDAAILLHAEQRPESEVLDHLRRWGLMTPDRAAATLVFLRHPLWRHYVATYAEGSRLVAAWLQGRPEGVSVAQRFLRLLDEPLLPSDLAAELAAPLLAQAASHSVHPPAGRVVDAVGDRRS